MFITKVRKEEQLVKWGLKVSMRKYTIKSTANLRYIINIHIIVPKQALVLESGDMSIVWTWPKGTHLELLKGSYYPKQSTDPMQSLSKSQRCFLHK